MSFVKAKEYLKKCGLDSKIKEFDTSSATVREAAIALDCKEAEIAKISTNIKIEHYCKTGLKVMFDNHCPKTIGIIAELDSLYQPGHKYADPETGAAQA